ncbi:MAG: 1-acyl-sn-glycerol-3-phosphate acyltransferase [Nitrospina sp.]|nr:1-acyl-sn-glycerol-3-phosphate acyltransferase [Nitrospina sp.]
MKALIGTYHTIRFWTVITLLSLFLGTVAVLLRLFDASGNTSHKISALWARLLCILNGIQVEIEGLEHARPDRAQVFVANHQSFFDIFTLAGFLPVQIRWVAKASLFKIPFVGWSMTASGYISVEREDRKNAYKAFLASVDKLKSGASIVIFPEGTRSRDGLIGEFKKGGTLLATRAGVPIVPVTIMGTSGIIQKGSSRVNPGRVKIVLSPPIEAEELRDNKEGEILARIRETICHNYAQMKRP